MDDKDGETLEANRQVSWAGWAIAIVGSVLMLPEVRWRFPEFSRGLTTFVPFCMVLLGSTMNLVGSLRAKKARISTEAALNKDRNSEIA